jgi:hypothetical protein
MSLPEAEDLTGRLFGAPPISGALSFCPDATGNQRLSSRKLA